ncbi:DUF551 domain-containing protein [Escherichia coli]|uniref:DUF551 domain-containing protein n=1 Tax=Escherichia coli TaxID=562 RepID=UPI000EF77D63|nr:DUF551 domain-containing protein [Escherichia coli]RLX35458.1 DUF551 domain-containing protein [Escherichia coli]
MSTITKERLLTIKQWRETYGPGSNVVLPAEEAEELARIALASLEAEPVAWKATFTQIDHEYNTFTAMYSDKAEAERWVRLHKVGDFRADITPLYTSKPVPVVPGEIADDLMEKLPKSDAWANGFRGGWNSCRAVMLQSGNFREISETSTCSPVILAGWISCSERMPEDGQHVIILCDGAFVLYAQYRDGEFFDVVRNGEEFFETQSRNVTHWMPLPEPPSRMVNDAAS